MNNKKKFFIQLKQVTDFINSQIETVKGEYFLIVEQLERDGRLSMPFGEKLSGKNLFAIRVIQAGNIRVFYVYGHDNKIYAIHGYAKKTQKIPQKELKQANNIVKLLRKEGLI